ncbi:DNA-directed DNA polymerase [Tanacetum coccineum]
MIVALRGEIYFVKFIIKPEEDDIKPGVVLGRSFLRLTKGIADFGNGIITIYPDLEFFNDDFDKSNESEDDWDVILEGIDFGDIPIIDGIELPQYGPSLTINLALTREELSRKELEKDLWERILDGELELEEVEANEQTITEYKAIKEKDDPDAFVLPIRLERRFDTHALADNGSNINIIPYRIFEKLGREQVKPVRHNVSMLNHSEAEPMWMLKDVLCQVGVTTVLARFLVINMPIDYTVLVIVGRSFLHTYGGIINTLIGTTSTFDGVCHQKFYVAEIQNVGEESDNDDEEEYCLKRDDIGRPFYGPNLMSYFDHNDPMERSLAI